MGVTSSKSRQLEQLFREQEKQQAEAASRSGISGVPFFRINGRDAFSGAQPEKQFIAAFRAAAAAAGEE